MKVSRLMKLVSSLFVVAFAVIAVSFIAAQDDTQQMAHELTEQEEAHRDLLYRVAEEGLTAGDFDVVAELVADDFVIHSPIGDLDREDFIGFIQALQASMSDFTIIRDAVIVQGEFGATRSVITGIFDGAEFPSPLGLLSPNGEEVTVYLQTFHRFDADGRIVEEWAMFDLLSFFTQLGAIPAPEA